MREIKFRAKDYQTNKWVYGFLFMGKGDDNRDYAFILQDKGLKVGTATEDNAIEFPCDEAHLVDKETICQYTGLKDKNGKEIYEGDILKHSYWDRAPLDVYQQGGKDEYIEEILIVKYSVESGRYLTDSFTDIDIWICEDSEVIGNIYDNPELVEG